MNVEADFGLKIRQALNEGAQHLDARLELRLQQARRTALSRFDAHAPAAFRLSASPSVLADTATGIWSLGPWGWVQRLGVVVPLLVLVLGFAGISQWREAQRIHALADMDFAVLMDDGPLEAYADQGFGQFITQEFNR